MERRGFLFRLAFAPLALIGLAQPKNRVQVSDMVVKITCDASEAEAKLARLTVQPQGVYVQGNYVRDMQPGGIRLGK